ncbi:Uncharacterised protein [Vibrio cholerae]|uniref:Uncharacterized protein n=1 Tax=Vibrio cholerae TaxID=666 RepID=A0A655Q3P5_VIBCL|nr:Uncharacterised protein [Vibrio cholerae]CSA40328.1 Uncharacterised protein [Vibrio cholerae]CSA66506.1 Uncharacterised protein [Vibrio cholerae]CSA75168.1 Uncharacterised protein [Vibrio cholerae]
MQLSRKARHAQHTQGIFHKRGRNMAQHFRGEIALTAIRINQLPRVILRHRVDGQIAAQQIVFQTHVWSIVASKAGVTYAGFAFGTGKGMFFFTVRMQKHRKIFPDSLKACR